MPVSKPKPNESEQDFVSRVIPELVNAGKPKEQAAAIAYSTYRDVKKARSVGGFESPEPGDIPESEKKLLASVYAKERSKGTDKEKAAKIAWGAVHNSRKSMTDKSAGQGVIDPEELRMGTKEEMDEHNLTLEQGMKIAVDHLRRIPDYYTRLKDAGL